MDRGRVTLRRGSRLGIAWAILCLTALPQALQGQDPTGSLSGRVFNSDTQQPLAGVSVQVEGTRLVALTDTLGHYQIVRVPAGPHMIRAEMLGFAVSRFAVTIPPGGVSVLNISMSVSALRVEGITVTVDPVASSAEELGTVSVIDREAIAHQTATTLGDVLQLIPGAELSAPGLGSIEQVALRSVPTTGSSSSVLGRGAADLAAFGTLIVVDGVPLSNNANLQSLGNRSELFLTSSAGGGVDLRRIPASTIERVEVIRGIPSVRYGDLTNGAVIVETRAGAFEPEVRGRLSAKSGEGSALDGWTLGNGAHTVTLALDLARTRTQPGISDDVSTRVALQAAHRFESGTEDTLAQRLVLDSQLELFRLEDDHPENANVRFNRSSRSEDLGIRILERLELELSPRSSLSLLGSFSRTSQHSSSSAVLFRSALPFTNRTTEGMQEGFYVIGPYNAEVSVEGAPSLLFGRAELRQHRAHGRWLHDLLAGLELRREWTPGAGMQFDIERPPQSSFNGVQGYDRPRSFNEIAGLATSAVYLEDRLQVALGSAGLLQVQGGLRLDLLNEGSHWFSGIRDVVAGPRVNVAWAPVPAVRLRGGFGMVAKAPAVSDLYPAPQYYDVVNVNQLTADPVEHLAVLTTFIRDPENQDLGFSRGTKLDAGLDFAVGQSVVALSAFRDNVAGAVAIRPEPTSLLRDYFQLTDSVIGNGIRPEIILPAGAADTVPVIIDRPDNFVEMRTTGFEVVASFQEIRALRTRLHVTASWMRTRMEAAAVFFGPRDRFTGFQLQGLQDRAPYWVGAVEIGEKALVTYRLIHQQPSIGLVISAAVQHNIHDKILDATATDTLSFEGYVTRAGELVPVPQEVRGDPQYADLRRTRGGTLTKAASTPGDWIMSLQVSKSLPGGGRLNFWAYNLLDNRGVYGTLTQKARFYPAMQFGLELVLAPATLLGGRR